MRYIDKIEITPIEIQLKEPFVISKGPLTHARNTVVKIYASDGAWGLGECCPYRTIHGETQAGSVASGKELANLLIGKNPAEISHLIGLMDRHLAGNASIKCAFDMALYDLNARAANLPLYMYLHGDRYKDMVTDMTISLLDEDRMCEKAMQYKEAGFKTLKIKLGDPAPSKDISRVEKIRMAVGDTMILRIDANQGWNYHGAKTTLNRIYPYNIQHCEAPIAAGNFLDLQRLNATSPIAIMGDESIFSHCDGFRMLAHQCVDLINIKLGKTGGIHHAMKLAGIAEAAGVDCQVGSFSESRLGITALAHFAMAWRPIKYYDMDSPLMHSEDPIIGGLSYDDQWKVIVGDEPGLGCTIDPKFLDRFTTSVIDTSIIDTSTTNTNTTTK